MATKVNFKALKHARGAATRVPATIKKLFSKKQPVQEEAWHTLREQLVGRGEWYDAAPPSIELLANGWLKAPDPILVAQLISDIIGGNQRDGWLRQAPDEAAQAANDAMDPSVVMAALRSKKANLRVAAAVVAAQLHAPSDEVVEQIGKQAREDDDLLARASALLALGRLSGQDDSLNAGREAEEPLVCGAAAVAWLRRNGDAELSSCSDGLIALLGVEGAAPTSGWFADQQWRGLPHPSWIASAVAAVALQRGDAGREAMCALLLGPAGDTEHKTVAIQATKVLLELGAFPAPAIVATRDELNERQVWLAGKLADTCILPRGAHGLPACGRVRQRWLGDAEPGPLDASIEIKIGRQKSTLPIWRAWHELQEEMSWGNPLPEELDGALSGLDRWEGIIEFISESYCDTVRMEPEEIDRELAAVEHDDALLDKARQMADDLARRYSAASLLGLPLRPGLGMGALLLLPLLRAGKTLEPTWHSLIPIWSAPHSRELLAALDDDVREQLICDFIVEHGDFEEVTGLLDLAPTTRLVELMRSEIDRKAAETKELRSDYKRIRKALDARVKKLPELK